MTAARTRLDRDLLIGSALALVDEEGSSALTMRRLAERLGVTPMAIYNHVRDKQDLADGVAEKVAREVRLPPVELNPGERVAACLRDLRRALLEHPNALPILQATRSTASALLAPTEFVLEALAEAGFEPEEALAVWAALSALTTGHLAYQFNRHLEPPGSEVGSVSSADFPRIAAAFESAPLDFDDAYELALDGLVRGLFN